MSMGCFFSIIVPVYNVAPWLRSCLGSVCSQTCDDWECICVDDGSADESSEILREFANKDKRFRCMRQQNAGVSAARNAGLAVAKGSWIVFLDGDDMLAPMALERIGDGINRCPMARMVHFGHQSFQDESQLTWAKGGELNEFDTENKLSYDKVWSGLWEYAYHREVVPTCGFAPYSMGEDLLFMTQALCKTDKIVGMEDCLYAYRCRNGSAVNSNVTLRKFNDHMGYLSDRLSALRGSGKRIDRRIYRRIGLELTENASFLLSCLSCEDGDPAWKRYFECMDEHVQCSDFTHWTRYVVKVLSATHSHFLAKLLCLVPFEMKKRVV